MTEENKNQIRSPFDLGLESIEAVHVYEGDGFKVAVDIHNRVWVSGSKYAFDNDAFWLEWGTVESVKKHSNNPDILAALDSLQNGSEDGD